MQIHRTVALLLSCQVGHAYVNDAGIECTPGDCCDRLPRNEQFQIVENNIAQTVRCVNYNPLSDQGWVKTRSYTLAQVIAYCDSDQLSSATKDKFPGATVVRDICRLQCAADLSTDAGKAKSCPIVRDAVSDCQNKQNWWEENEVGFGGCSLYEEGRDWYSRKNNFCEVDGVEEICKWSCGLCKIEPSETPKCNEGSMFASFAGYNPYVGTIQGECMEGCFVEDGVTTLKRFIQLVGGQETTCTNRGYTYGRGRHTWSGTDPTGLQWKPITWSGKLGQSNYYTDVNFLFLNGWSFTREPPKTDAGFDFSAGCSGDGSFTELLPGKDARKLVGGTTLPAGLISLKVRLTTDEDVDIQLYDAANDILTYNLAAPDFGFPIVGYCGADVNGQPCSTGAFTTEGPEQNIWTRFGQLEYVGIADMLFAYSGYNGIGGKPGVEELEIPITTIPLNIVVYSYTDKLDVYAEVTYSWQGKDNECCACTGICNGVPFEKEIAENEYTSVGIIPAGVKNVIIKLATARKEQDLDIALYAPSTGRTIIGYCNSVLPQPEGFYCPKEGEPGQGEPGSSRGIIDCRGNVASLCTYFDDKTDLTYYYSGWDGIKGYQGEEEIKIVGELPYELEIKAYGFKAGVARVTYSYENAAQCP